MDNRADATSHALLTKLFSKRGERIYVIVISPLEVSFSLRRELFEEADWKMWICFLFDPAQHLLNKLKVYIHVCYLFSFFLQLLKN